MNEKRLIHFQIVSNHFDVSFKLRFLKHQIEFARVAFSHPLRKRASKQNSLKIKLQQFGAVPIWRLRRVPLCLAYRHCPDFIRKHALNIYKMYTNFNKTPTPIISSCWGFSWIRNESISTIHRQLPSRSTLTISLYVLCLYVWKIRKYECISIIFEDLT